MKLQEQLTYNPFILPAASQTHKFSSFSGLKFKQPLKQDTVSFSARDLLSLPKEEIFEKIEQSIKDPLNKLGEGADAVVYRIKGTDYCVRIVKDYSDEYKNNFSLKLSEKDKINHNVANLGRGSTIMRYIEGYPVKPPIGIKSKASLQEISDMIVNMPEEAYMKFFKQICHAKKHNMIFDCSWWNVIINPKNQTMTAIDFYKMLPHMPENVKPLNYIYASLVHNMTPEENKKVTAGKLLSAVLHELKNVGAADYDASNYDFKSFIYKLRDSYKINLGKYEKLMLKTFAEIEDLKRKAISGNDVSVQLNGKIKMADCLINQLFF